MIILGIETSCDETAAAVIQATGDEKSPHFDIISNIVSSQVKLHAEFGGIIPNLAAREHTKNIIPVVEESLAKANVDRAKIDLIAVTRGPGLIPALLVGTSAAKTLAYSWEKPIVGVNHMEGHIYANWLENSDIKFPALCLTVSGGHTELVLMKCHKNFELIGKTRDDAVGEAFDKAARLLGLGYPGGPAISKASEEGIAGKFSLPRPMLNSGDFDFSFSGIKTAVRTLVEAQNSSQEEIINNIAAEFQQASIDVLAQKTMKASEQTNPQTIILAGGVAANKELRKQLGEAIKHKFPNIRYLIPAIHFCTDNAAMIAIAGYFHKDTATNKPWDIETDANISIAQQSGMG